MKTLPKYFAIKQDENNPLWEKYISWMNAKYRKYNFLEGCAHTFYGWDGERYTDNVDIEYFSNPVTVLTLEEWDSIVNGTKNKNLTYETQYLRSDGTLFTKDSIGGIAIEALTADMKKHISESNRLRGLLKAHKNKFSN